MKYLIFAILLMNILGACTSKKVQEGTPKYFIGKELIFNAKSEAMVDSLLKENKFVLVSYVDSSACTPCALDKYNVTQVYSDSLQAYHVATMFLFYGSPQPDITLFLQRQQNRFAIAWDTEKDFKHKNRLLADPLYHDFIIDSSKKIIWISSPFFDSKTWEYCRQAMKTYKEE